LGAIYEIGALAALSESLRGIDFNDADVYVGVSAGAFIAAGLANGFTPHQMSRLFIEGRGTDERFDPAVLLHPALREYGRRVASLLPLFAGSIWHYATRPVSLLAAFERLSRAIPTGLFDGEAVGRYLAHIFSQHGRTNDFRSLRRRLFLVATDLDTGEAVAFGAPGVDHVPISRAVQASSALPGVFPPVEIDGRTFVDGALRKTLHASIALDEGVQLLICLNPLVPYNATPGHRDLEGERRLDRLVDGGLPVVLAQTFRSIIHSRLDAGMERYKTVYPDTDIVLLQPSPADADMFFTKLFSYSSRRRLCEHAYQRTRAELLARRHELGPKLARHGVEIDIATLRDDSLTLVKSLRGRRSAPAGSLRAMRHLEHALSDLEHWIGTTTAR